MRTQLTLHGEPAACQVARAPSRQSSSSGGQATNPATVAVSNDVSTVACVRARVWVAPSDCGPQVAAPESSRVLDWGRFEPGPLFRDPGLLRVLSHANAPGGPGSRAASDVRTSAPAREARQRCGRHYGHSQGRGHCGTHWQPEAGPAWGPAMSVEAVPGRQASRAPCSSWPAAGLDAGPCGSGPGGAAAGISRAS